MPDRLTWSTAEVAAALGHSVQWFYQRARALRAAGFPQPLPIVRRYDPAAVRAWIDRQQPQPTVSSSQTADAWAAELDRRAALLGRGGRAA
jgi:hypothetical protein